jgi:hypothetical protein
MVNSGDSFLAVPLRADGLVTVLGELARRAICKFDSLKSTSDVGPRLRALCETTTPVVVVLLLQG